MNIIEITRCVNACGLSYIRPEMDGQSRSCDVMVISRPDDLGKIANLGLTLAEAKQRLVSLQQYRNAFATRGAGGGELIDRQP